MKSYISLALAWILLISCAEQQQQGSPADEARQSTTDTTMVSSTPQDSSAYQRMSGSMGQLIYVPVYSHIYQQDRQKTFNLTATLSIRNADPFRMLKVTEVAYYDSGGQLIQHYLENPQLLGPQSSISFVVEERDLRGGVGANFLVSWESESKVNVPVVEAVMISTSQQQGISFISAGRVLQEY